MTTGWSAAARDAALERRLQRDAEYKKPWWERTIMPSLLRSRLLRGTHERMIREGGTSSHSARGDTLRLIVQRLEEARCPYTLTAIPGRGYIVEVPDQIEREWNRDLNLREE